MRRMQLASTALLKKINRIVLIESSAHSNDCH